MTHDLQARAATLVRLRDVRAAALDHYQQAMRLSGERRVILEELLTDGMSRADIARELGVSRQAISKMLKL